MNDMSNHIAARLYTVYCKAVGGKAHNGDPLPTWEEFSVDPAKRKQYDAWMALGHEVRAIVKNSVAANGRVNSDLPPGQY